MKRLLLLTISSITIASISNAQINRGTVLLGGTISASSYESDLVQAETKSTGFRVSPTLGFTIKDNHVLGFNLSYGHSKSKSQQTTSEGNSYGAGAFYRRYLTLGKGFYLFAQGTTGYGYSKIEQPGSGGFNRTTWYNDLYASFYPGLAYTVSKRFHLEVGMNSLLGVSYSTAKDKTVFPGSQTEGKNKSFSLYSNANPESDLSVGFRIALGK